MGENTTIEWTHHTFNPWWGCSKISPACAQCYAEVWARRFGVRWGPDMPRRLASERYWQEPLKWNAKAEREDVRRRVFCASMADVFDNDGGGLNLDAAREWLWEIIEETPALDWLLLTKRIGNAARMLPARWLAAPQPNVWLGSTLPNREEMLRDGPKLKAIPAVVHFWSVEPMLGDLGEIPRELMPEWVICGGESGRSARPMHPAWVYSLRDQCNAAGVPFLFKQWGEWKHMGYSASEPGPDPPDGVVLEAADPRWRPYMWKIGKKRAGRVLNTRTWDEFPRVAV
jgi:protein gp37